MQSMNHIFQKKKGLYRCYVQSPTAQDMHTNSHPLRLRLAPIAMQSYLHQLTCTLLRCTTWYNQRRSDIACSIHKGSNLGAG